jgi:hypothetical protein
MAIRAWEEANTGTLLLTAHAAVWSPELPMKFTSVPAYQGHPTRVIGSGIHVRR